MNEHTENPRSRVTTSQWLTLGVLATIFVVVLVVQFGPAADAPPAVELAEQLPAASPQPTTENRTVATPPKNGAAKPSTLDPPWPAFSLATVQEFDPFTLPPDMAGRSTLESSGQVGSKMPQTSAEDEKKRIERTQSLAEVRKEVVQTIVGTDRGFVAIVGTKTIRVGDRLHGFLVKDINSDGVILENKHD